MNYLLIWKISGFADMGGGIYFERFKELSEMDTKVDALLSRHGTDFSILVACEIKELFQYEPTEIIKKLERK